MHVLMNVYWSGMTDDCVTGLQRLVIENDELRRVLRQHNILIPPPPSLRAKLRITADGPMVCQ